MRFTVHLTILTTFLLLRSLISASDPLHLTPFLDHGKVEQARNLSRVMGLGPAVPESYSGFITVDKTCGNHLFFWFFPASRLDAMDGSAPLMVWLNGGPTVSSMVGLLYENGPIRVKKSHDSVTYEGREKTWTRLFSMLYIDSPVGTGYSYTESGDAGYRFTQDGYSSDLYSFMEQFYVLFPEYLAKELYIGGQSYAGKFVPALAYRIHREKQAGNSEIPLTGIYLGGPLFDLKTQGVAAFEYFYAIGAVSDVQMRRMQNAVIDSFHQLETKEHNVSKSDLLRTVRPEIGIYANNIVTLEGRPDADINFLMRSESFRSALHVGNLSYDVYNHSNLADRYGPDILVNTKSKMAVLLDSNNYKVLLYTGNLDALVSPTMMDAALKSTPWSHQAQFNNSELSVWKVNGRLYGFYTKVAKLCRVTINGGGHQTPHDQPGPVLEMMKQFVQFGCIQE